MNWLMLTTDRLTTELDGNPERCKSHVWINMAQVIQFYYKDGRIHLEFTNGITVPVWENENEIIALLEGGKCGTNSLKLAVPHT